MSNKNQRKTKSKDREVRKTNDSSILSKASVEKCGYPGFTVGHSYYQPFIQKSPRRSPSVNRGYWTRCMAIRFAVYQFLKNKTGKRKAIVNLGAGYDPLAFQLLSSHEYNTDDVVFYDVDYPETIENRVQMIRSDSFLSSIVLEDKEFDLDGTEIHTKNYHSFGCNLNLLNQLESCLEKYGIDYCNDAILFISEVAAVYMPRQASEKLIRWMSKFPDAHSCFFEQIAPATFDHPFANVMVKHFKEWGTPLHGLYAYPTIESLKSRWVKNGWEYVEILDVCTFWNFLMDSKLKHLCEMVEPFDEWEEFYFFLQHYSIQHASSKLVGKYDLVESPDPCMQYIRYVKSEIIFNNSPLTLRNSIYSLKRTDLPACLKELPSLRLPAVCDLDDSVIVQGGLSTAGRSKDAYLISEKDDGSIMKITTDSLTSCMGQSVVSIDKKTCMFIGGRESPKKILSSCIYFADGNWSDFPSLPYASHRASSVSIKHNGSSYVVLLAGKPFGGCLIWSDSKRKWNTLKCKDPLFYSRWGACLHWSSKLKKGILCGGMNELNEPVREVLEWEMVLRDDDHFEIVTRVLNFDVQVEILLSRIGSKVVFFGDDSKPIIVGGAAVFRTILWEEESVCINMNDYSVTGVCIEETEKRPVFTMFGISGMGNHLQIFGGGCICFSFGSCLNENATFYKLVSA
ncbi:tRNA methyltransferase Ppm2 [Schizosaccharomyces pombe]|uniref:tRNA wybutosine-synthesizing protein 4 n=1 Tax=Schizosaccharomyces pombe (strain 972 / ATCC 24843) TaxID=284812 RepID=TYW4_SCHPO|nr:putative AdoMet-dependent tRNA methyltransferase [Schizosaccharomyces pombe]O60157.1 RecName: Full=tRNA wybutosine-synthesizing protein 4; Short=tRNA-yW synthesizing protein 4; AltName: Full=Leucine carboxyl methyltransferase 2; AltName: Full=tRNA(Phe) (7-(3-amino-3-(methoxycarbonyl)propyl)wyosine(37)-N)-methoxycarbonyltransferase; AltName: Full=tRNA(Phe) (7-(3-amino-3-carboxypropyl)wyosine(37)-O)-methyltransferase [Schizosaccharomyces pombe 972h-]CAA19576.1 AdoMet-dependent tRNA methyltransfe|eukprot:NP_596164.1 putative AdoMet-dependent tRNA methyltransferase [Schizosaccharomyces pombe]